MGLCLEKRPNKTLNLKLRLKKEMRMEKLYEFAKTLA
jgi:hypothetical protein